MYHRQWKAHKKTEMMEQRSEGQRQRSYIPASYDARKNNNRTKLPVPSVRPTDLVTSLNGPAPLTGRITGAQVDPQAHNTGEYL